MKKILGAVDALAGLVGPAARRMPRRGRRGRWGDHRRDGRHHLPATGRRAGREPGPHGVAAVIAATMRAEGWGDRGVQLAIAVAWAESRLANATTGDGTSRGVFQQLEGYAGTDLAPDPTARWWGPWSGQRPPAGIAPATRSS